MNKNIQEFTAQEWSDYPKDHFDVMIKSWCEKHGYKKFDIHNKEMIYTRLPYRKKKDDPEIIEVAADFLGMVEKRRTLTVFQPTLPMSTVTCV